MPIAKIQDLVFLLWEEPKVSDIPGKPVGERLFPRAIMVPGRLTGDGCA